MSKYYNEKELLTFEVMLEIFGPRSFAKYSDVSNYGKVVLRQTAVSLKTTFPD
jgi:hypothetical protein